MENDLVSIYENTYLRGNLVQESKQVADDDDTGEDESTTGSKAKFKKTPKGKSKKSMNNKDIGGITYDSFSRSTNVFAQILKEMDEIGGGVADLDGDGDNVFDAGSDAVEGDVDEQTFTLSELKAMTLAELADLLVDTGEDDDGLFGDDEGEGFGDDEIPTESFESNYKGDQGLYDGKARVQAKTTHVKANGDADFGKQKTGYDPEDTEGSEGAEHGAQGDYSGKAKVQAKTTHVKANGDADFGKSKTGAKTSSGKKEKNYF